MAEKEQSGMLRVVVVLGVIALIAGALVASLMTLKGRMAESTNTTTFNAAKKQVTESFDNTFASMQWDAKDNVDVTKDKTTWNGYGSGQKHLTIDDQGKTALALDNDWSLVSTPSIPVPSGAKTMTVSVRVLGHVGLGFFMVNKPGEDYRSFDGSDAINGQLDDQWHTMTKTINLDGKINTVYHGVVSNVDMTNRSVNIQFMKFPGGNAAVFSQVQIDFAK